MECYLLRAAFVWRSGNKQETERFGNFFGAAFGKSTWPISASVIT
jgi:hypothetical protein